MTIYRCILPSWASEKFPNRRKVVEGELTEEEIITLNEEFYNIYFLPNNPSIYHPGTTVDGSMIDTFNYCYVDMDLKDGVYKTKDEFIFHVIDNGILPSSIVDSGNGIHCYWQVSDLDAMGYLRLQRRLMRHFKTDEAVGQIYQLMRVPNTANTKDEHNFKLCEILYKNDKIYSSEDLDKLLPPLAPQDLQYCEQHFDKTYKKNRNHISINDNIPLKFSQLLSNNNEVKELWAGNVSDRSASDFRLAHIMFAHGFTKEEAASVLVNAAKAMQRAPVHRMSYATNIVDKIWVYEETQDKLNLSLSVKDILSRPIDSLKGTRFSCHKYFDDTKHGFRLGQVIGLVAGSGVGKTAVALNMFEGFVANNPDYVHFFIPLEQPANEIADRWKSMCGDNIQLYEKVHIIDNYDENDKFRHLSFEEIKDYLLKFQKITGKKVGCVVIDHIGALRKKNAKNGENQDLMEICHSMKAFALETKTLLVMQSQAPRDKAGIGDLELSKDAAYGTVYFESYCDYLITIWQPLKRCYKDEAPTVTAFKFCKIRHKKQGHDNIKEDVCYRMIFDPETERLREANDLEEKKFKFWLTQATNKRKQDRHTDMVEYVSVRWDDERTTDNNKNTPTTEGT